MSTRARRWLVALALLPVGFGVGLATALLHSLWWGLALGTLTTGVTCWAAPAGLPRVGYAVGWLVPMALFVSPRPEGDFLISGDLLGYSYLTLGLLLLAAAIGSLPRPAAKSPGRT